MPDGLTPDRLRALIAAATPGPWTVEDDSEKIDGETVEGYEICIPEIHRQFHNSEWADPEDWDRDLANAEFIAYLATHAPALADALEAKKLLEALMGHVLSVRRGNTDEWMEGLVETLNATELAIGGKDRCEYRRRDGVIRVLRAAKEAADA